MIFFYVFSPIRLLFMQTLTEIYKMKKNEINGHKNYQIHGRSKEIIFCTFPIDLMKFMISNKDEGKIN